MESDFENDGREAAPWDEPEGVESNASEVTDAAEIREAGEPERGANGAEEALVAPEIVNFSIRDLKHHPLSNAIYGPGIGEDLVESIRTLGVLQPILVARGSLEIISGNSRVQAARILGYEAIQGTYFSSEKDLEVQQAVLESNSQRIKTNEQKIREYNARKTIESELALLKKVGSDPNKKPSKAATREATVKARDHAAKKIGVSAGVAEKATKVIAEADRLKEEGKVDESTELINALNKSIKSAHKMVTKKDAPTEEDADEGKIPARVVELPAVTGSPHKFLAQEDAIGAGQAIVRFLRMHDASDFTPGQGEEWVQISRDIAGRLRELGMG